MALWLKLDAQVDAERRHAPQQRRPQGVQVPLLGDADDLDAGKQAWLNDAKWQELRRYVEDTLVVKDWFELFVAQNLVLDGLLYDQASIPTEHHPARLA